MSQTKPAPFISIIIINFNGGDLTQRCLDSLSNQSYQNFEVIVVDNGSTDASLEITDTSADNITLIELGRNTGFAYSNNRGAEQARGEWLILLNNDAFPETNWLETLVKTQKQQTEFTFFSSHQINYHHPELLDGTGDMYAVNGRAWRRDYNATAEQNIRPSGEVFGACAAAAMYKKSAFDQIGAFDEDYFCHFEDVDLAFRLRLAGHRCLYVAEARVHHIGSATAGGEQGDFALYQGNRNSVWTYFKCMPLKMLIKYLPQHLHLNYLEIKNGIHIGKKRTIFKSKLDAFVGLFKVLLIKRRKVQKLRKISDMELEHWMGRS
ncbi:MAG: glycosyltransferase family 2 protein [gamma proteobacterium symbiont of Taylorina sp.]|nr:glycosyltransferase family 2 protein [gamma proteobacterium symbiont of Taylorina sp.]